MARLAYNVNYSSPRQLPSANSKPHLLDDDGDSILGEHLDLISPTMSPNSHLIRRESFADTTSTFSPREGSWPDFFSHETSPANPTTAASHVFPENSATSFMRPDTSHGPSFVSQSSAWYPAGSQGSNTPTAAFDGFGHDYDTKSTRPSYANDGLPTDHPNGFTSLPMRPSAAFHPVATHSISPQSGPDWLSGSSPEQAEFQNIPANPPLESPNYHHAPSLVRRDGIRKKNARFEIPAERTLRTIDHLINQTNDEAELKELKQQKRLLRNRQAA